MNFSKFTTTNTGFSNLTNTNSSIFRKLQILNFENSKGTISRKCERAGQMSGFESIANLCVGDVYKIGIVYNEKSLSNQVYFSSRSLNSKQNNREHWNYQFLVDILRVFHRISKFTEVLNVPYLKLFPPHLINIFCSAMYRLFKFSRNRTFRDFNEFEFLGFRKIKFEYSIIPNFDFREIQV